MVETVEATVVRGKFHEAQSDGSRRCVRPNSENPNVRVTPSQLVAFKSILVPTNVAKAQADAQKQMEQAMAEVEKVQEQAAAKTVEVEEKVVKEVEKEAAKQKGDRAPKK